MPRRVIRYFLFVFVLFFAPEILAQVAPPAGFLFGGGGEEKVSKVIGYGVLKNVSVDMSKEVGYGVLKNVSIGVSKTIGYAVLLPCPSGTISRSGECVSKLVGYGILTGTTENISKVIGYGVLRTSGGGLPTGRPQVGIIQ